MLVSLGFCENRGCVFRDNQPPIPATIRHTPHGGAGPCHQRTIEQGRSDSLRHAKPHRCPDCRQPPDFDCRATPTTSFHHTNPPSRKAASRRRLRPVAGSQSRLLKSSVKVIGVERAAATRASSHYCDRKFARSSVSKGCFASRQPDQRLASDHRQSAQPPLLLDHLDVAVAPGWFVLPDGRTELGQLSARGGPTHRTCRHAAPYFVRTRDDNHKAQNL